jgi:hypothetical protein
LHPHWHSAVLDGVFVQSRPDEAPGFRALRAPTRAEQQQVGWEVCQKVTKLLQARGVLLDGEPGEDALSQDEPLLASCATGSLLNRSVLGPRAGQGVLALGMTPRGGAREVGSSPEEHAAAARRPAHGWDVHAGVRVPAGERKQLERLLRYMLRPPLSEARLLRLPDGRVRLRLQRPWRNGTRFLVFQGIDFLARLVPLVPPPRVHQVVAHGVLAPRSRLRSQVVPAPPEEEAPAPPQQLPLPLSPARIRARAGRRRYIPRALLMKRTLEIDPLVCPRCGRQMRVGEAVTEAEKIREMLSARGIAQLSRRQPQARAPPPTAQLVLPWNPTAAEIAQAATA